MSRIIEVITKQDSQIKPGPEGGDQIGYILAGQKLEVLIDDPESPHDGFVTIKGPKPNPVALDGTWKVTGIVGWIELAHVAMASISEYEYRIVIDAATGTVKSCTRIR